jgi:hypothetical protein
MSAIPERSKNKDLVVFNDYLKKRPSGNESPVSIKAADLDKNFNRTTLIENPDEPDDDKTYQVSYKNTGTVLNLPVFPKGTTTGDLLYWDAARGNGGEWAVLRRPGGTSLKVLGFQNGNVTWISTQDCE